MSHSFLCERNDDFLTTVILAEKPKQAASYAKAFSESTRKDGYYQVSDRILPDETFLTYGFGHLVELSKPEYYGKTGMSLENLPIFPDKFHYDVTENSSKQFYVVKDLLERADTIVVATDCDREGENIAWSIMKKAKIDTSSKEIKRLWINSLEKAVIRQGFSNLKDDRNYYKYYLEAEARKKSDWLVGMNLTELYSILLQRHGLNKILSIGRVQTPTLYMIEQRDRSIAEFKSSDYYELEIESTDLKPKFTAKLSPLQRFEDQNSLNVFKQAKGLANGVNHATVKSIENEQKATPSPMLFSLSSLQSEVNRRFKASASETLAAVQNLYEAGLLSYPRTDCNYITQAEYDYLKENIQTYGALIDGSLNFTQFEAKKRYVDGNKVQEHYAIIPTKQVASQEQYDEFSELEKKVYWLVISTTIAMFLEPYRYNETSMIFNLGQLEFVTKGKILIDQGWKKLFGIKQSDTDLPSLDIGKTVTVELREIKKQTKPPKAYTEGTLITAMKTAGKTLSDKKAQAILKDVKGIGTEATRANIISGLQKKGYLVNKKNELHVTDLGKILCRAVESSRLLTSIEMTAKWEEKLQQISKESYSQDAFLDQIKKFISELLLRVPETVENDVRLKEEAAKVAAEDAIGVCPKCHQGQVIDKGKFYGCSNYDKSGCRFSISKDLMQQSFSKEDIKKLLAGKKTSVINGLVGKKGKAFSARFFLDDNAELKLEFASKKRFSKKKK